MAPAAKTVQKVDPFAGLPSLLRDTVRDQWDVYRHTAVQAGMVPGFPRDIFPTLTRVWAASDFVVHSCLHTPELLPDLLDSGDLLLEYAPGDLSARVRDGVGKCRDEPGLMKALRDLRRREMVRIAWRDLAGWAPVTEILRDLSELADATITVALDRIETFSGRRAPKTADGRSQHLVVIALGKLGAKELNFSSDVDLMFAFPEEGEFRGRNSETYSEYFTRIGHSLIRVLSDINEDGFVFRVDMRLRPFGDSGPLVMSFEAMEEYYQSQGRDWERYAMIKARPVTGPEADRDTFTQMLRPFVFRRYLDFGAFHSLREMKEMIARQVERKGLQDHIKLGPGGIREIEFLVQAFQLIRGGRERALRERSLLKVLARLPELGLLPEYAAGRLAQAYEFLRRVENRLQELADRQAHKLPGDERDCLRLALSMGYEDWESFREELDVHRSFVSEQFAQVVTAPQEAGTIESSVAVSWSDLWSGSLSREDANTIMSDAGFEDADQACDLLDGLRDSYAVRVMDVHGRARLDRLMPLLLAAVSRSGHPVTVLNRIVHLLEAVAGRSAYLSLLAEHPLALSQLIQLVDASPWIANQLASTPVLLDELLDARSLYAPPARNEMRKLLRTHLAEAGSDLERQMDELRELRRAAVLRVAAADISGAIQVARVSDLLSEIAESVLSEVASLAYQHVASAHGTPVSDRVDETPGFAVIAYGKLGGRELGYGSDLDLVFVHRPCADGETTSGPKPVDAAVFFMRVGQRIIHLLNTTTAAGVLYEIDMRLRPSGASGLLVTDIASFEKYQKDEAWTWEHQALVRARPVCGDSSLAEAIATVRHSVLARERDEATLASDVIEMAGRMRAELDRSNARDFDLKYGRGGVTDVEFMIQYLVLRWCRDYPALSAHTGNVSLLTALAECGVLSAADAESMGLVYLAYRERLHQLSLQEAPSTVNAEEYDPQRSLVTRLWGQLFGKYQAS